LEASLALAGGLVLEAGLALEEGFVLVAAGFAFGIAFALVVPPDFGFGAVDLVLVSVAGTLVLTAWAFGAAFLAVPRISCTTVGTYPTTRVKTKIPSLQRSTS